MIFATVGSTQIPFERFVRALETLPGDRLLAQHGPVAPPAGAARCHDFMSFPEVEESMRRADAVVCHAGAGSILCALRAGHVPVVVPRLKRFGETVDDHQVELARVLAGEGKVRQIDDLSGLAELVAAAPSRQLVERRTGLLPIQAAVREVLHDSVAG